MFREGGGGYNPEIMSAGEEIKDRKTEADVERILSENEWVQEGWKKLGDSDILPNAKFEVREFRQVQDPETNEIKLTPTGETKKVKILEVGTRNEKGEGSFNGFDLKLDSGNRTVYASKESLTDPRFMARAIAESVEAPGEMKKAA